MSQWSKDIIEWSSPAHVREDDLDDAHVDLHGSPPYTWTAPMPPPCRQSAPLRPQLDRINPGPKRAAMGLLRGGF